MAGDLLCLFPAKSGRVAVASGWAYGHRGGNPARLGERVCACVVLRPGESLTLDELVLFLRDKIATCKLPEFLHLAGTLPRTPTGKVQKGPLRDLVLKGLA